MLRAISLRESWMREIRTSGLTRERAPNGPSLLYNSCSVFDHSWATALCSPRKRQSKIRPAKHAKRREKLDTGFIARRSRNQKDAVSAGLEGCCLQRPGSRKRLPSKDFYEHEISCANRDSSILYRR